MCEASLVDRYVKDPDALIELCREVVTRLKSEGDQPRSGEQLQLREIAKAIERLDSAGVAVPDVLRGEKTRLVASLAVATEAMQGIVRLADALDAFSRELRGRAGQAQANPDPKARTRRKGAPRTSGRVLREHIILALKGLGGAATVAEVMHQMECQLGGKLLPGDLDWVEATNEPAWMNGARWERFVMTKDGDLRNDSPRGTWELSERHR